MGSAEVKASTQNQALSALLFLYRDLLEQLDGVEALVTGVLYGGGLRLMEALRLRVHDLDVQRLQITVRDGKGGKDRRTMLPARVAEKLQAHLQEVQRLHRQDLADGYGRVPLPTPWGVSTPMPRWNGTGNGYCRNSIAGMTPKQVNRAATISIPV
jgi:integrase